MSDLSWLNPTPHAIAVYASRPLSPVATQHSLPSGRYSLLGPDFHRLDRASFAWRTHPFHPLIEDHLALVVHHVVELQQVLADVEVARLQLLLRLLQRLVDPGMNDRIVLLAPHPR